MTAVSNALKGNGTRSVNFLESVVVLDEDISPKIRALLERTQAEACAIFDKCDHPDESERKRQIRSIGKLFNAFELQGHTLFFPKKRMRLRVHEILDIYRVGIDIQLPQKYKLVKAQDGRVIGIKDSKSSEKYVDVNTRISVRLDQKKYGEFIDREDEIKEELRALFSRFHKPEFARQHQEALAKMGAKIGGQIESVVHDFAPIDGDALERVWVLDMQESILVPRPRDWEVWDKLPALDLGRSLLESMEGDSHFLGLQPRQQKILELQQAWQLPSLFNDRVGELLLIETHRLRVLMDKSNSTTSNHIYMVLDLAGRLALDFIRQKLPNVDAVGRRYSSRLWNEAIYDIDSFSQPEGGTNYHDPFIRMVDELGVTTGTRVVLNLSDGLPCMDFDTVKMEFNPEPAYEKARQAARLFPENRISYGQIIFGHDVRRLSLDVQRQVLRSLGAPEHVVSADQYAQYFTEIARAANGGQVLLWVTDRLAEMIVSYYDLALGEQLLRFEPYTHLLSKD